jgi:hypothetical protein
MEKLFSYKMLKIKGRGRCHFSDSRKKYADATFAGARVFQKGRDLFWRSYGMVAADGTSPSDAMGRPLKGVQRRDVEKSLLHCVAIECLICGYGSPNHCRAQKIHGAIKW